MRSTVTPIGITTFRNSNQRFGIKEQDRFGHIYCIGKTGTGKSTLLQSMVISDIQSGNGVCVIDPHGDVAENILNYVPAERVKDVVYFNPADTDYPTGFNPLKAIDPSQRHTITSGLIGTFKKIWVDSWGPRLEYILRNSIVTLLDFPNSTILDIQPLLTNPAFRSKVIQYCKNAQIKQFWEQEFDKYSPQLRSEVIAPVLNKVGLLYTNEILRNIVGQHNAVFSLHEIMDNKRILICNLSKGLLGEDVSALLGSMLITAIQVEALRRASQPSERRVPFYLYVDEIHSFVSLSFADILSEARKYKLALFLTHQYMAQLDERIREAIIGNAGTLLVFRIGSEDAIELEREFAPTLSAYDLIHQEKYSMYSKLMIDGVTSKPFSTKTLPILPFQSSCKSECIEYSRFKYSHLKKEVEEIIHVQELNKAFVNPRPSTLF
jgi:hypothetical protein